MRYFDSGTTSCRTIIMAERCSADMEVRSPQQSFSAAYAIKGQTRNYKKFIISLYNEEENLQEQPTSPQATRPMPPLEPLDDDVPSSCAFAPIHPKKRLRKECEDPMLAEAAASPTSPNNPFSPHSTSSRLGECEEVANLKSPTADAQNQFGSEFQLSGPNSLFPLSDSPYSSSASVLSFYNLNSPAPTTQASSPQETFPITTNLAAPGPSPTLSSPLPQENLTPRSPAKEGQQDFSQQKQCPRPQSVALDLTSLPKQTSSSACIPYHHYQLHPSIQHYQQANPHPPPQHRPPPRSTITQVHCEGQQRHGIRKGFQIVQPSHGMVTHAVHPHIIPQTFDRSTSLVPPPHPTLVQPKTMYSTSSQQSYIESFPRHPKMHRLSLGGGVIKPKPYYHRRPIPPHLMYQAREKHHILMPSGSQSKRMPSEMISYGQHGFPGVRNNDMPSISFQPPTAATKQLPGFLTDGPEGDRNSYKHRPIHSWNYKDVVYFMEDAIKEFCNDEKRDIQYQEISGTAGKDLCNLSVEDFKRFFIRHGEKVYQVFRRKVEEERRQNAAFAVSSQHETQNKRVVPEASPFEFMNQSNNYFHPGHHPPNLLNPQPPPTAFMRDSARSIDASAPYEIRYETVDARSIGLDDVTGRLLPSSLPSASGKTFDPLHAPSPAVPFNADENMTDPDQSSNEEEAIPEPPPKKRGPGRPRKPENELKKKKSKTGRLWEFIRNLLLNPETCPSLVKWENAEEGIFRFVQADKVAQRWGERKKNKEMNYEKLSRAMRYYYKGGVFEAVIGRRLVYKFGKNAKAWRPSNPNFVNQVSYPQSSTQ